LTALNSRFSKSAVWRLACEFFGGSGTPGRKGLAEAVGGWTEAAGSASKLTELPAAARAGIGRLKRRSASKMPYFADESSTTPALPEPTLFQHLC